MKFTKMLAGLAMATILFTGCSKDDPGPGGITIDDNGNVNVGADADGAMYSIKIRMFDGISGTNSTETESVFAWYGNATAPKDAGVVTANDVELLNFGGAGMNWYTQAGFVGDIFTTGNTVTWDVAGNTTNGIAAFSYADANPFPPGGEFTLPTSININGNFTLNHTTTTGADAVIYQVAGNKSTVTKSVLGASSSVTFTAAEMNEAAYNGGDPIAFMVMPVSIKNSSIGGKKYYFVKQYEQLRETVTQ